MNMEQIPSSAMVIMIFTGAVIITTIMVLLTCFLLYKEQNEFICSLPAFIVLIIICLLAFILAYISM